MSNTWFTSDLHFGHANVIKYCNRPYASAEEMDEALIANWNANVKSDNTVIILGDVFFCKEDRAISILRRLNGRKKLLLGNHDKVIRNSSKIQSFFDEIFPDLHEINIDGQKVVISHYPLLSWNNAMRGSYMLHGHSHGNVPFDEKFRRLDIGVDCWNYRPVSWREVRNKLDKVEPNDIRDR